MERFDLVFYIKFQMAFRNTAFIIVMGCAMFHSLKYVHVGCVWGFLRVSSLFLCAHLRGFWFSFILPEMFRFLISSIALLCPALLICSPFGLAFLLLSLALSLSVWFSFPPSPFSISSFSLMLLSSLLYLPLSSALISVCLPLPCPLSPSTPCPHFSNSQSPPPHSLFIIFSLLTIFPLLFILSRHTPRQHCHGCAIPGCRPPPDSSWNNGKLSKSQRESELGCIPISLPFISLSFNPSARQGKWEWVCGGRREREKEGREGEMEKDGRWRWREKVLKKKRERELNHRARSLSPPCGVTLD